MKRKRMSGRRGSRRREGELDQRKRQSVEWARMQRRPNSKTPMEEMQQKSRQALTSDKTQTLRSDMVTNQKRNGRNCDRLILTGSRYDREVVRQNIARCKVETNGDQARHHLLDLLWRDSTLRRIATHRRSMLADFRLPHRHLQIMASNIKGSTQTRQRLMKGLTRCLRVKASQ